jgi:hypothetical protein
MKFPARLIPAIFVLITQVAGAQSGLKKLKEFPTPSVRTIALDRLGDFYLTFPDGSFKKYDTEGNFMSEYSNGEHRPLTLLEPWNPLRLFTYSQDKQDIILLDHNLELLQKIPVDPAWAIEPVLGSQSSDNNFWILDASDLSLKKIESKSNSVLREVILKTSDKANTDLIYLREYQGFLFLVDRNSGISIFNQVGTLMKKIPAKNQEYVGFLGEEFYYLEDGKLIFFDLDTEAIREVKVDADARFVMVTDERMIVVKAGQVQVFEFKL